MIVARSIKNLVFPFLALSLVPWLAGCESAKDGTITGRMWEATGNNHRQPAAHANLQLYHTIDGKDVLVRYNEEWENNGAAIKPRAFLLLANEKKLAAGKRPSFLSERKAAETQSASLEIVSSSTTNAPKTEEMQAMIATDGRQFTLVSNGKSIGHYCLPTYSKVTWGGKIERAFFLPAAVTGDVTVFSAIIAYCGALIYASGHH